MTSKSLNLSRTNSTCQIYTNYPNIQFYSVNLTDVFSGTPLAAIENRLNKNADHAATHLSDLMREAVIYKFGGFYMDLDFVVLRSLLGFKNVQTMEDSKPK